jgi:DNA replication protein DnaD
LLLATEDQVEEMKMLEEENGIMVVEGRGDYLSYWWTTDSFNAMERVEKIA